MRRLGELSGDGSVEFADGTQLRPEDPIELEMAMSNASGARGYLALLRSFVAAMEGQKKYRREALRSLLAPELTPETFSEALRKSEAQEEECSIRG